MRFFTNPPSGRDDKEASTLSETTYNLYALCQGSRACDASWLLYLSESGRTRTLPYFFWALTPEGGGAPVVIDTGFSEDAQKARNPDYADYRPQHELLRHFDLKPSQVETMIVSHLHWDHFASPRLFTSARFYLQRRELDFWRSDAAEYHFINHFLGDLEEAEKLLEAGRLELVDGEAEVADGVHVHWTGGHTPGHQIVRFRTARGWAVLAVDAAYLYRSLESMIPPGIHVHVDDALRALEAVKDLADSPDLIFAGHDETDLRRKEAFPGVRRFV